ncbi:MAG TPA: FAD-dependent monooxygenase [Caulobacteraceae bacterium]|nr:FAD-dependent monooxygenase [Caulobacteraceae bacterium]
MAASGSGESDIVIVGAGFAGALLALVLARRGRPVTVVDLHDEYPVDFRCEKFSVAQVEALERLGVTDALEGLVPGGQPLIAEGIRYERMVRSLRAAWPARVRCVQGRVEALNTGEDRQEVVLADGRRLGARLVVLAAGPMSKLAEPLGVRRVTVRRRHSFCVGFSIAPADRASRVLKPLSHHGERAGDGMGYVSLFPMDGAMRVNLFCYRDPTSAWARACLEDPVVALFEAMPRLKARLGPVRLVGKPETRATDLYQVEGHVQPGVVLIGDAFRSSCPATGMGISRILGDVGALMGLLPAWLSTPGMSAAKIGAYYADPLKRAVDETSDRRSELGRRTAVETTLPWRTRRLVSRLKREVAELMERG